MHGVRVLLMECPFVSHNGNVLFFRNMMGFTVARYQFESMNLEAMVKVSDGFRLADFDMIVICISGAEAADIFMEKNLLDNFKKIVRIAEQEKLALIPVVGMNLSLSGEKQVAQTEIFDGLFIGRDSVDEQIREMLTSLVLSV